MQHNLALLRQKICEKFIIPGVLSETQIHHPLEYYRRPRFIIPWSTIGDPDSSSLEYYRRPRFIIPWSTIGDPDSSSLEYYRRPRFIIPGVLSETQMIHHRSSLFTIEGPYSSLEILIYHQTPLYLIGHPYWSSETHTILLDTLWIPLENIIPHRRPIEFHRRPLCPIGAEPLIIIGDITFIFFYWYSIKDVRSPMKSKLVNEQKENEASWSLFLPLPLKNHSLIK